MSELRIVTSATVDTDTFEFVLMSIVGDAKCDGCSHRIEIVLNEIHVIKSNRCHSTGFDFHNHHQRQYCLARSLLFAVSSPVKTNSRAVKHHLRENQHLGPCSFIMRGSF